MPMKRCPRCGLLIAAVVFAVHVSPLHPGEPSRPAYVVDHGEHVESYVPPWYAHPGYSIGSNLPLRDPSAPYDWS
jgi:hypothetical protein